MNVVLIGIIGMFLGGAVFWFITRNKKEDSGGILMLQDQLKEIRGTLDTKLGESTKTMQDVVRSQFKESQDLIKDITKEVTEVKEVNKQVSTITEQLQNLEKIFKNQKQRGSIGEAGLELTLSNILPPASYKLQYGFKGGDIVDAVIIAKDGIIPVDAKFSLDNYLRIMDENDEPLGDAWVEVWIRYEKASRISPGASVFSRSCCAAMRMPATSATALSRARCSASCRASSGVRPRP